MWDGDNNCAAGFTRALPQIKKDLPQVRMGAVPVAKVWAERFHASWRRLTGDGEGHIGPFDCFLVDYAVFDDGYESLSWLMFRAPRYEKVLLLGGGVVTKGEYGLMLVAAGAGTHPQVNFHLFDVGRIRTTVEEELSALLYVLITEVM